jgi:glycosyltransferase involved in cell wall biosynthesis
LNIRRCLDALHRFDDLVVVDSGSRDETVRYAAEHSPTPRVFQRPFTDFGDQRNWAIDHTSPRHPWILFVDADEFMEDALASEIDAFVRAPGAYVGGFIAGRNYFLGRWLRYTTFFPSYQLRLLRRGRVSFRREGHGQREVADGPLAYLAASWRHEAFSKGVAQWIARHNRYSTDETELIHRLRREPLILRDLFSRDPLCRRRAVKHLGARVPLRAVARLLYTYIWRRGFLDGRPGLYYTLLRFAHDLHLMAKLAEAEGDLSPREAPLKVATVVSSGAGKDDAAERPDP